MEAGETQRDSVPAGRFGVMVSRVARSTVGGLVLAAVVGEVVAVALVLVGLPVPDRTAEARALGIVSRAVLDGYPSSRDVLTYLLLVGLPLVAVGVVSLYWRFRRPGRFAAIQRGQRGEVVSLPWRGRLLWAGITIVLVGFLAWNRTYFRMPNDGWRLLVEEGFALTWANRLLAGEVMGRDFNCQYGPLLIYPLAWLMEATEPSMYIARVYTFLTNCLSYLLVIGFLAAACRRRAVIVLGSLAFLLLNSPYVHYSLNSSHLRVTSVLPALALLLLWRRRPWLVGLLIGVVAGLALQISQECGLALLLALSLNALVALAFAADRRASCRRAWPGVLAVGGGVLLALLPMAVYFQSQGALGAVWHDASVFPRYHMMGFGGLAMPSLQDLAEGSASEGWYLYFLMVCLVAIGVRQGIILFSRGPDARFLLQNGLLLFSLILFRVALARTDEVHIHFVSPPVWLGLTLWGDDLLAGKRLKALGLRRPVLLVWLGLVVLGATIVWGDPYQSQQPRSVLQSGLDLRAKTGEWPTGVRVDSVPRADVYFSFRTATALESLAVLFQDHPEAERVYFYPTEATYSFLFAKRDPTRFPVAPMAVTRRDREGVVADLIAHPPDLVVYSTTTGNWDVDIPIAMMAPEIEQHLRSHYRRIATIPELQIIILEPIPAAP